MMRSYRLLVALLWQAQILLPVGLLLLAAPASAAPTHLAAELVASGPAAPGGDVQLAIHFRPEPGWHGYWLNPGDAGVGMALTWNAPTGARIQPPHYPVPQTLLIAGLMNHVYEHDYAVLQTFTIPADARQDEQLAVSVKAEWLACTVEICVPESAELRTTIKVHARQPGEAPQPIDHQFDTWNSRLPAPLGAPVHFAIAGDTIRLAIPLPASQALPQPHLFIGTDHVTEYAATQLFRRKGDMLIVELRRAKFGAIAPDSVKRDPALQRGGRRRVVCGVARRCAFGRNPARECQQGARTGEPALAAAGRAAGRVAAQCDALRLPDPQPQGAESRACRRERGRCAARGAGLHRRGHSRLHGAGRAVAGLARGWGSRLAGPSSCRSLWWSRP